MLMHLLQRIRPPPVGRDREGGTKTVWIPHNPIIPRRGREERIWKDVLRRTYGARGGWRDAAGAPAIVTRSALASATRRLARGAGVL